MIRKKYFKNCDLYIEEKEDNNSIFVESEITESEKKIDHYKSFCEANNNL